MASLEAKILGEDIKDNYCSSSEDESDQPTVSQPQGTNPTAGQNAPSLGSSNTGPKGVVEDYRRYKQLQVERNEQKNKDLVALAQKLSMTCRSYNDDMLEAEREKQQKLKENCEEKVADDEEDEFLREYLQKRMTEMQRLAQLAKNAVSIICRPKYGAVIELSSGEDYLSVTENKTENILVLIFIYEPNVPACKNMHRCFDAIAEQFPSVKCCKVRASVLQTSAKFRSVAVPALQAYRGSDLVGNFVRLTDEFGTEIHADDVIGFLQDYGILPDHDLHATGVSSKVTNDDSGSDSDFGID